MEVMNTMTLVNIMRHTLILEGGEMFERKLANFLKLFFVVCFGLSGCANKPVNLDNVEPYRRAIGKSFILQQDLYVIRVSDGSLLIGVSKDLPAGSGVPEAVEMSNVGMVLPDMRIVGIARRGSLITIVKIEKIEGSFLPIIEYYVRLESGKDSSDDQLLTFPILNREDKPPYFAVWSSPPIFKAKYALPNPADGEWWK